MDTSDSAQPASESFISGELGSQDDMKRDDMKATKNVTVPSTEIMSPEAPKRDLRFRMCIVAVMVSSFLIAMDYVGITNALPTIIGDLNGTQFEWVGSAYGLAATAFLPFSGGMAQVFGRRSTMLLNLFLFALGSAICGASQSMNMLIGGRTVQGIGAGGITSLSQIILSDLVPLHKRGTYNALVALAYAMSAGVSPVISGALAQHGQWRWFFYLNLPICGFAGLVVIIFLNLNVPRGTFKEKVLSLDWIGNFIVMASITSVTIALTWGGIEFPWTSARVLSPLVIGLVGIIAFIAYDAKVPRQPLVPFKVLSTRTAISGHIQGFFTNFYMFAIFYYLAVYFQACKGFTPIASGVDALVSTFTCMPCGVAAGISVAKSKKYRPQLWFAWVCMIVGAGLFSTLDADSSRGAYIAYQLIPSFGMGILLTCTFFPVLAPIPLTLNANALAFFMFLRFFSQSWGVAVGGSVLQNELGKKLPADFISQFPQGTAIAYAIIPIIRSLEEPLKREVQVAFGESLRAVWLVLIGASGLGLLASLMMKGLPLHTDLDRDWGLVEERKASPRPDAFEPKGAASNNA